MNLLYFSKGVKCGFHVIIVGPSYECVYMVTLGESRGRGGFFAPIKAVPFVNGADWSSV